MLPVMFLGYIAKAQTYCTPSYSSGCSGDNISSVTLGTLNESGLACVGSPGYTDRTTAQTGASPTLPIPSLTAGSSSTLTLTFGSDGSQYNGVWIDFDHNGVFNTNEFFTSNSNAGGGGTANITLAVPAAALSGQARMRIRAGDDSQPSSSQACGASNSGWGVARDYFVNIVPLTAPPPCVAAPAAPANGSNVCMATTPTTLSWSAIATASSYDVYLDQGSATTLVGNVTTASYTTAAPLSAGIYSWKVIPRNSVGPATGCSIFSFMISPVPVVNVSPAGGAFCNSGSATLTASGANTYTWSPATGLNTTTGATVTATPAGITTYTVTGTSNGCSSSATATVGPISAYTATAPSQTVCANSSANISVSPIIPISGSMEYELTDTLGNPVAGGGWQSSTAFTITPAAAGLNKYFILARNTTCPSGLSNPGQVTIFSGFSATVTGSNATCANGNGSLAISNPFGAGLYNGGAWYSNDFSTATIADTNAAALRGGAVITGSALQLTPNVTSQHGGLLVKNPMGIALNVDSVKFLLSVPQNGADGISWSFADNIVYDGGSQLECGAGNKLIISFDAYGSGSPGANGIYLTYGQAGGTSISTTQSATMLAYSGNTSWRGTSNTPIAIYITPAGKLTLKVGSTTIFNQVQLPTAYVNANRSTWQHLFAARTGGVSEQHVIDNLGIYYSGTSFVFGSGPAHSNTVPSNWQTSPGFSGLNGGDSLDLWIANPSNPATCNQKLGTYGVSGPLVTAVVESSPPSCVATDDGYISMKVSGQGTYSATYTKNGGTPVIVSGITAQTTGTIDYINIANLGAGSYTNLKVTSAAGCVSNIVPGPVTLAAAQVTAIPSASSSTTAAVPAGGGTHYLTDNACAVVTAIGSSNDLGNVTASVTVGTAPVSSPAGEPFLGRYYEITPTMNSSLPATLTLYFTQADFDAYNASAMVGSSTYPSISTNGSNLRIRAFHGQPSGGATGPNSTYDSANADLLSPASIVWNSNGFWQVTFNSPHGFSGFFANTNTNTPLRIALKAFEALNDGAVNHLSWETGAENTGDRFIVERSRDSRNFTTLHSADAKGTPSLYRYTDQKPFAGVNYYRLSLIDADGRQQYSKVVKATVQSMGFSFEVYPNPVKEQLNIRIADVRGKGKVDVSDATGRIVDSHIITADGTIQVPVAHLPDGLYFVQYHDDVHTRSVKINKQ